MFRGKKNSWEKVTGKMKDSVVEDQTDEEVRVVLRGDKMIERVDKRRRHINSNAEYVG